MTTLLNNINIAIVGGGRFCKALLEAILDGFDQDQSPVILGVADPNAYAVGRLYAILVITRSYMRLRGCTCSLN
ncbi:MAG: hypothetical protein JRE14_09805 [Deltaproteobacteria bacterium]|nr:hypothetical protein [Deltaproteobacteria bacterium]